METGETGSGLSRRSVLRRAAVGGAIVWATPVIASVPSAAQGAGTPPPGSSTSLPGQQTTLSVTKTARPAVFTGQEFDFTIVVSNTGLQTATGVTLLDAVPSQGAFVSSNPSATPSGGTLTLDLGDISPGGSVNVTIRWKAPSQAATLQNRADASATNAASATGSATVQVGTQTVITGGATAAGTALRNRDDGTITIAGIPAGATVTRAVLVWVLLYSGTAPPGTITFQGTPITADLTASTSGTLCWGDSATIGYAADVTSLVSGNGLYAVTDPQRGTTREDADPEPVFPVTDGASLVVFYAGPGVNGQVFSDFNYNTNTAGAFQRAFSGINSVGGPATLFLAGPDGQNNSAETIAITGSGTISLSDTFEGSDPITGPSFSIGNLWDTDGHDVSSVVPAGQPTLTVSLGSQVGDCIGVSAAILVISQ